MLLYGQNSSIFIGCAANWLKNPSFLLFLSFLKVVFWAGKGRRHLDITAFTATMGTCDLCYVFPHDTSQTTRGVGHPCSVLGHSRLCTCVCDTARRKGDCDSESRHGGLFVQVALLLPSSELSPTSFPVTAPHSLSLQWCLKQINCNETSCLSCYSIYRINSFHFIAINTPAL